MLDATRGSKRDSVEDELTASAIATAKVRIDPCLITMSSGYGLAGGKCPSYPTMVMSMLLGYDHLLPDHSTQLIIS